MKEGGEEAESTALSNSANDLRHGNPCKRAAIHHRGGSQKRRSDRFAQRQDKKHFHRP